MTGGRDQTREDAFNVKKKWRLVKAEGTQPCDRCYIVGASHLQNVHYDGGRDGRCGRRDG